MRKIILALTCVFMVLSAIAQTQQGYVKTKGRMVGRNQTVAGSPLQGATIGVKGSNTALSSANGKFSIAIPAKKYQLQYVKKEGYVLVDPDILLKSYIYSSNPMVIAMETPDQHSDDIRNAERKIRRTLQKQINDKEDRIEELMEQNKITQEQYREAMKALEDEQRRNGDLIAEMAEQYARMDFDQMDDFNQQVNDLILEGDLVRADSLLRSKGDIDARIAEVMQEEAAQAAELAELNRRQQNLETSIAGTQAKKNDIAQNCYSFYKKFILELQPDSALCYIEKRAALDPDNSRWQQDAASYCLRRGLLQKADSYYQKALSTLRRLAATSPEDYEPELAVALYNAAMQCSQPSRRGLAESYFQEAIGIFNRLSEDNPQAFQPFLAAALNNYAQSIFRANDTGKYAQAEELSKEALDIYWQFAQDDAPAYIPRVADMLNNLALFYDGERRYEESEPLYNDAVGICRRLVESNPKVYNPDLAATLNNLSAHYDRSGQDGVQPLLEALDIYRLLDKDDPQLYGPQLAAMLHNLSTMYYGQGLDEEAEKASYDALDVYRRIAGDNASGLKPVLANRLFDQAIRLYQEDRFDECKPLFEEYLAVNRDLATVDPSYLPDVAKALRNLASTHDQLNHLQLSRKLYDEELNINLELAKQNPAHYNADVARSYGNLSNHAMLMKDFDKAVELANKGIAIDDSKLFIQANLALAYLCLGETARAEEIYSRYKSQLHDMFLNDLEVFTTLGLIPKERRADVESIRRLLAQ